MRHHEPKPLFRCALMAALLLALALPGCGGGQAAGSASAAGTTPPDPDRLCLWLLWVKEPAALTRAQAMLQQGEPFQVVAQTIADQSGRDAATSADCLSPESMDPAVRAAAAGLELGQVSQPIPLAGGTAIVMRTSDRFRQEGRRLFDEGKYDQAEKALLLDLDLHPASPASWHLVAMCRSARGDHAGAIQALDQALRWAPDDPAIINDKASALLQSGRAAMAVPLYRRALTLAPESPVILNNLAWAILKQGSDLTEAEGLVRRALALSPKRADIWETLGQVQQARGRSAEAVVSFHRAALLDPSQPNLSGELVDNLLTLDDSTLRHLLGQTGAPAPGRPKPAAPQTPAPVAKPKPAPKPTAPLKTERAAAQATPAKQMPPERHAEVAAGPPTTPAPAVKPKPVTKPSAHPKTEAHTAQQAAPTTPTPGVKPKPATPPRSDTAKEQDAPAEQMPSERHAEVAAGPPPRPAAPPKTEPAAPPAPTGADAVPEPAPTPPSPTAAPEASGQKELAKAPLEQPLPPPSAPSPEAPAAVPSPDEAKAPAPAALPAEAAPPEHTRAEPRAEGAPAPDVEASGTEPKRYILPPVPPELLAKEAAIKRSAGQGPAGEAAAPTPQETPAAPPSQVPSSVESTAETPAPGAEVAAPPSPGPAPSGRAGPATPAAPPAPEAPLAAAAWRCYVQLETYSKAEVARPALERLLRQGQPAMLRPWQPGDTVWLRLLVGPFANREAAVRAGRELVRQGPHQRFMVVFLPDRE